VYRWDNPDMPISYVQFDPFDSPWKPASPAHRRADKTAAAAHGAPATGSGRAQPGGRSGAGIDFDAVDDLRVAVDSHERAIVEHALGKHRWNQRQTAKALGLSYDQLRHAIKKHSLMEEDG
jgi:psp operon transcriptional activator